jgi:hypothetical protein
VEPEAIDLDHESLLAPQKVDLVTADADVHVRGGQLSSPNQPEEPFLGIGSDQCGGLVGLEQRAERCDSGSAADAGK